MKKKTKKKPPSPIYFLVSPLSRPRKSTRARSRPNAETRVQEERVSPRTMVLLDVESIKSMAPGRFFRDHKGPINSLDFHHSEDLLVTTGAFAVEKWDGSISLTRHPCPPPSSSPRLRGTRDVSRRHVIRGDTLAFPLFFALRPHELGGVQSPQPVGSRARTFFYFFSLRPPVCPSSLSHTTPLRPSNTPRRDRRRRRPSPVPHQHGQAAEDALLQEVRVLVRHLHARLTGCGVCIQGEERERAPSFVPHHSNPPQPSLPSHTKRLQTTPQTNEM